MEERRKILKLRKERVDEKSEIRMKEGRRRVRIRKEMKKEEIEKLTEGRNIDKRNIEKIKRF